MVRHIRDRGAMRGGIFDAGTSEREAMERVRAQAPMDGLDLAREVSPAERTTVEPEGAADGARIAALDTGIKSSIVAQLRLRGVCLELHPCDTGSEELLASDPDAVFLANGPGDPAALDYVVDTLRGLVGKVPVFGICLGHQLMARALGGDTYKLPFGHHGGNHPVRRSGQESVEITSHNHNYAVAEGSVPATA